MCISVTSHALDPLPLSQTVTPSRTPSPLSVTYFMDGPIHVDGRRRSPSTETKILSNKVVPATSLLWAL